MVEIFFFLISFDLTCTSVRDVILVTLTFIISSLSIFFVLFPLFATKLL